MSRADLGTKLGLDLSTDDKALIAVDAACDICRTVSGQTFNLIEDDEIVLDGTGTDALVLPEFPVVEVSDVTENDQPLVVDDDYALTSSGLLIRRPTVDDCNVYWRTWRCGRQNIVVTYSHGWDAATFPRDVRAVALALAERLYKQNPGVVFESQGQYSVRYGGASPADLTPTESIILAKYRRTR